MIGLRHLVLSLVLLPSCFNHPATARGLRFEDHSEGGTRLMPLAQDDEDLRLIDLGGRSPVPALRLLDGPAGIVRVRLEGISTNVTPRLLMPGFREGVVGWTLAGSNLELRVPHDGHCTTILLGPDEPARNGRPARYPFDRLREFVSGLPRHPFMHADVFGRSVQGRDLWRIYIEDATAPAWSKRTVVVLARIRGDSPQASFVVEALIQRLLGLGGETRAALELDTLRLVIYPMLNPDGAQAERFHNANSADLDRSWSFKPPQATSQEPEIYAVQNDIEEVHKLFPVSLVVDLRGAVDGLAAVTTYTMDHDPAFVTEPAWRECRTVAKNLLAADRQLLDMTESDGVRGSTAVEIWRRLSVPVVTVRYDDSTELTREAARERAPRLIEALFAAAQSIRVGDQPRAGVATLTLGESDLDFTIEDDDQNRNPNVVETVRAWVADPRCGDIEGLLLAESAPNTGVFRLSSPIKLTTAPARSQDGQISTRPGSILVIFYQDPDYRSGFSVKFVRILAEHPIAGTPVR